MKNTSLISFLSKTLLPVLIIYLVLRFLGKIIGLSLLSASLLYVFYYLIFFFEKKPKRIHKLNFKKGFKIYENTTDFNFKNLITNTSLIVLIGITFYGLGNVLSPSKKIQNQEISKPHVFKNKQSKQKKNRKSTNNWDRKKRTNPYGHGRLKKY